MSSHQLLHFPLSAAGHTEAYLQEGHALVLEALLCCLQEVGPALQIVMPQSWSHSQPCWKDPKVQSPSRAACLKEALESIPCRHLGPSVSRLGYTATVLFHTAPLAREGRLEGDSCSNKVKSPKIPNSLHK